jgi:hypothetical protein
MKGEIRALVEKDGKVRLSVEGVNGPECLKTTEFLERELGEVNERRRTRDFYALAKLRQENRIIRNETNYL